MTRPAFTRLATIIVSLAQFFPANCGAAEAAAALPAAIFSDPPADAFPASTQGLQFRSGGSLVNAILYRPAGAGPHPVVVLLHGLPGYEQSLDLAQSMRRAGWTVITFHYRGSWGSGGKFTLEGGVRDTAALIDLLRQPDTGKAWRVDPSRIVLVGHSYGGWVAAQVAAHDASILGIGLIAPWDIGTDAQRFSGVSAKQRAVLGASLFDDVGGRLSGADARSLTNEVFLRGKALSLGTLGTALAAQRVLVVTASRDDPDDQAIDFLEACSEHGGAPEVVRLDTDHSFSDRRIALQASVLNWLSKLPSAPH